MFGRLGEEFAGFIPGSSLQEGCDIAERIRIEFAALLRQPPQASLT